MVKISVSANMGALLPAEYDQVARSPLFVTATRLTTCPSLSRRRRSRAWPMVPPGGHLVLGTTAYLARVRGSHVSRLGLFAAAWSRGAVVLPPMAFARCCSSVLAAGRLLARSGPQARPSPPRIVARRP